MPYLKIWIHVVWSVKNREPLLTREIRYNLFEHIRHNGREKDVYIDCINGFTDHVHCLISLGASQSISKVMQLLKGESAYWANQHKLCTQKLEWQDEYFAASISHSMLRQVRNYIYNQEKHHATRSFAEEYNELIERYESTPFKAWQ